MPLFTIEKRAPDALFGLKARYNADESPKKVDLGIGAYRDDNGKPWVLPVVQKVEAELSKEPGWNHEYLPIAGLAGLRSGAAKLTFGEDSKALKEKRVASIQTISGTGANHLGGLFLTKFPPFGQSSSKKLVMHVPDPTWANHVSIFEGLGFEVKKYKYYDGKGGLDIDGLLASLSAASPGDIVLFHACAHNPTGVDPTQDQWKQIADVVKAKQLFSFLDTAYQGFATGDLAGDAYSIRLFESLGLPLLVCQSFAKNFGLYGERTGCLHVVTEDAATAEAALTQLEFLGRTEISNPPAYGAKIVSKILNDKGLFADWEADLQTMSSRIEENRVKLRSLLEKSTGKSWEHITNQIGMFSYTGLTPEQVDELVEKYHIYLMRNGRVSMAGLNSHNIEYVAESITKVVS